MSYGDFHSCVQFAIAGYKTVPDAESGPKTIRFIDDATDETKILVVFDTDNNVKRIECCLTCNGASHKSGVYTTFLTSAWRRLACAVQSNFYQTISTRHDRNILQKNISRCSQSCDRFVADYMLFHTHNLVV